MKRAMAGLAACCMLCTSAGALAYRPFDSTDADVAPRGEFELELGPVGWLRQGSKHFLVAPAVVANIGISGDRELVFQGQREVAREPEPGEPRSVWQDNGAFIKQVLRKGVLQDESGPSIATEYGLLLPSVPGQGTGFSIAGIVSQRWEDATLHVNAVAARTREREPDAFLGAILEGPIRWAVRPVAELFAERTQGSPRLNSALVGAIWRAREGLTFDVGVRQGHFGAEAVHEVRLGLTWGFSFEEGH